LPQHPADSILFERAPYIGRISWIIVAMHILELLDSLILGEISIMLEKIYRSDHANSEVYLPQKDFR
jgi:hypothetical protein